MILTRANLERGGVLAKLLVVLAVAGGGYAWYRHQQPAVALPIDSARVVTVERKDLIRAVLATGRIEPEARVAVMSRASGILKEVRVDVGDIVRRGQILAELDREQLVAQHNENLASEASAKARLTAARARLDEARVRLIDPELKFAQREVDRLTRLFDNGTSSQNELDDAQLRLANVDYRIKQVQASIPVLEAQVGESEAQILGAEAALERTATALREATILSPIDGVVLVRDKDVGDGISSILTAGGNATPLMTLGDVTRMYVYAKVDEVDVGRIYDDMRAMITVDAFRDRTVEGSVLRIAPGGTVDNNGLVTFEVKIAVEDPERLLRVDMTANTRLVLEEKKVIPTLPHKALSGGPQGSFLARRVTSLDPPQTEEVSVEIGISDGLITEILSGLSEGDRVLLPEPRRPS